MELDRLGIRGRDGWAPRGLSATARPGELTVFTGPNGAGKSTVLAAVLGLHTPDEGRVLIAGRDLASLDRDAHYGRLVWLPQHPVIVPGTVAENLDLFGELSKEAVAEAMRASAFDEVLADLPDGMDSVLGSGGAGLSAGQRQRLALTRTLASPARLLLLDEPTAHLDEGTAGRVIAALVDRARAGDTVIVVSHQKGVLSAADAVVDFAKELSDGR